MAKGSERAWTWLWACKVAVPLWALFRGDPPLRISGRNPSRAGRGQQSSAEVHAGRQRGEGRRSGAALRGVDRLRPEGVLVSTRGRQGPGSRGPGRGEDLHSPIRDSRWGAASRAVKHAHRKPWPSRSEPDRSIWRKQIELCTVLQMQSSDGHRFVSKSEKNGGSD